MTTKRLTKAQRDHLERRALAAVSAHAERPLTREERATVRAALADRSRIRRELRDNDRALERLGLGYLRHGRKPRVPKTVRCPRRERRGREKLAEFRERLLFVGAEDALAAAEAFERDLKS